MAKKTILSHFHRSQVGRAQRYMRLHLTEDINLKTIAREAGSSSFHFGRLFQAYTGETAFAYMRRIRLTEALRMIQEDAECSITEVALLVGYETPSAFNKVFKKILNLSPSDFRNLGKAAQDQIIYNLNKPVNTKEIVMNLTSKPDFVVRPTVHFVYLEKQGPFAEIAIPVWMDLFRFLGDKIAKPEIKEFLGVNMMDPKPKNETSMSYAAGVTLEQAPQKVPPGLSHRKMAGGKYARFILTGPYHLVWPAFEKVFQVLAESKVKLREGACIENYLNDPNITPEAELITELLVPVE